MQFRAVKSRIHCLAAWYDPETKRGRQKLVYKLDRKDLILYKPRPEDLSPTDFGTHQQRKRWADEIGYYINQHNGGLRGKTIAGVPIFIAGSCRHMLKWANSLSEEQRNICKVEITAAAEALGLTVTDNADAKKKRRPIRKTSAKGSTENA